MREGWTRTALGDVADIVGGGTPKTSAPSYWGGAIPWITPTEVVAGEGKVITSTVRTITELGLQKSGAKLLPPGTVLVTSRATVGAVAITGCGMATNQGFAALTAGSLVLPEFLMIWCQANAGEFRMRAGGSTFPEISRGVVGEIPIDLPPLDEQRRIVDLIGSLDATITATDQAVAKAEQARRASIVAFIGGQDPRRSLTRVTLAEITSFAGGYAFPEKHQGQDSGDVPFLKVSDMNSVGNETTITRANHWVSESTLTAMRARAWPPGTVIFPKVGAALLTEKRRVLGERAAFDNNIMGLIPGPLVEPGFLLAFMETVRLGRLAQPGAVPSVNQKHIGSIPLALPSLGDQRCIMGIIAAFDDATAALRATTGAARVTRRGILSGLLSGAHEIPSTYDRLLEAA